MAPAKVSLSIPFRTAHAAGAAWPFLLQRCLKLLEAQEPAQAAAKGTAPDKAAGAGLGFVYVTDLLAEELPGILERLRQATGIADWIGTTGIGIAVNGATDNGTADTAAASSIRGAAEYYDEPAMAIMLADWAPEAYRLFSSFAGGGSAGTATWGPHAAWIKQHEPPLAVAHADPRQPGLQAVIDDLAALSGTYLVGGLASSRGIAPQIAGTLADGGVSGVMLADAIPALASLSQGCSPIGPPHLATATDRNIVMAIDDRPALEVMKAEIGEVLSRDLSRCANYIYVGLPVAGSDTGDYLVRQLVGIDRERGWIAVGDLIGKNQPILFARRDVQTAREDLGRMLQRLKSRLDRPIRGGLYFSCLSRGANMFGPDAAETRLILETLGDFPLVGFFANGEISNGRLYGHTGVLTLFL